MMSRFISRNLRIIVLALALGVFAPSCIFIKKEHETRKIEHEEHRD